MEFTFESEMTSFEPPSATVDIEDPPTPITVIVTCLVGTLIVGAAVLYLCIKKQPGDDKLKAHEPLISNAAFQSLNSSNVEYGNESSHV